MSISYRLSLFEQQARRVSIDSKDDQGPYKSKSTGTTSAEATLRCKGAIPGIHALRQRENLPVIRMALVLYPGRAGIAQEVYADVALWWTIVTFRYLQISLLRLEATDYVRAQSVLGAGLARTMHVPAEHTAQIALHWPAC